jgi:hypothetical protein
MREIFNMSLNLTYLAFAVRQQNMRMVTANKRAVLDVVAILMAQNPETQGQNTFYCDYLQGAISAY